MWNPETSLSRTYDYRRSGHLAALCWFLSGGILDGIPTSILDEHTLLKTHYETIDSIPQIRDWMNTHTMDSERLLF